MTPLTWDTYRRMRLYFKGLQGKLKTPGIDSKVRFKILNERAAVNKWLYDAEKKLSFEVTGDWEFSDMVRSKYFRLMRLDEGDVESYRRWLNMTPWERLKSDPAAHRGHLERARENARIIRERRKRSK